MSKIAIEGMQFYAKHGVYAHEKEIGGQFSVDVYVDFDFSKAAETDNISDSINYATIFKIAEEKMQQPANLIEKICGQIMQGVQQKFPQLKAITVRVTKFSPPVGGKVDKVFVELSH